MQPGHDPSVKLDQPIYYASGGREHIVLTDELALASGGKTHQRAVDKVRITRKRAAKSQPEDDAMGNRDKEAAFVQQAHTRAKVRQQALAADGGKHVSLVCHVRDA